MLRPLVLLVLGLSLMAVVSCASTGPESMIEKRSTPPAQPAGNDHQEYLEFFDKVYKTMDENYYYPITREAFDRFVRMFDQKIYAQLKGEGKTINYIKWRSAAYLVDALKSPEDRFSAFFPPSAAKTFEQTVLGKKIDLGIEGALTPEGYLVKRIEPRSDAFEKGLREQDVIKKIDGADVLALAEKDIQEKLTPLEGAAVELVYLEAAGKLEKMISAVSREYFKQTVFQVPVDVPGVFCLQIQRFNRMTAEDLTRFMMVVLQYPQAGLVIDLRGNPGGPPLAAREISAFFLPPAEEFAYFQKKNAPKSSLDVPTIPERFHFRGDIAILVNKESGSSSELFSGILQSRGRATIIGTNTAGQVFLKSMYPYEDESMLLLVTARGFHPNGDVFSFDGVVPDKVVDDPGVDMVRYAAEFLAAKRLSAQ